MRAVGGHVLQVFTEGGWGSVSFNKGVIPVSCPVIGDMFNCELPQLVCTAHVSIVCQANAVPQAIAVEGGVGGVSGRRRSSAYLSGCRHCCA